MEEHLETQKSIIMEDPLVVKSFKFVMFALVLWIVACNTTRTDKTTDDKALAEKCCKECVEAFGQSPVGVGAAGAKCGEFSTAQPLSQKCADYFKANPRTVAECE